MKKTILNKSILTAVISAAILAAAQTSSAGDVTGLTSFSAGTPAVAAQVNGNFTAVKTAVDNNHARIGTLEGVNAAGRIAGLEDLSYRLSNNTDYFFGGGNRTMTGLYNTGIGHAALYSNTTGSGNTAIGYYALVYNTIGYGNTASGEYSLWQNTEGRVNTAVGNRALYNNTTGYANIAIGYQAGNALTTGVNNIAIGNEGVAGESNTIRIGGSVFAGNQTRTFISGIRGITTANANAISVVIDSNGQLGTVSSSQRFKDDIADMGNASNVLMQLRPVTFHYKSDNNKQGRTLQYGLVAEEVAKVAPNLVARTPKGEIETVFYQNLAPMLLNEYQKQQRTITAQTALLTKQTARIAQLEQQALEIVALKQQMSRMNATLARLQQPERVAAAKMQ